MKYFNLSVTACLLCAGCTDLKLTNYIDPSVIGQSKASYQNIQDNFNTEKTSINSNEKKGKKEFIEQNHVASKSYNKSSKISKESDFKISVKNSFEKTNLQKEKLLENERKIEAMKIKSKKLDEESTIALKRNYESGKTNINEFERSLEKIKASRESMKRLGQDTTKIDKGINQMEQDLIRMKAVYR